MFICTLNVHTGKLHFTCTSQIKKKKFLAVGDIYFFRLNINRFHERLNMKNITWLLIFSMLETQIFGEKWITSASFSKQNSYDDNTKLYHKLPLPFGNTYEEEKSDAIEHNTIEPDQSYLFNPFYPEFLYPPRPVSIPRANDVLVIILEQKMKCSNDTTQEQPPQPTPQIFPPPSRCIWAIVACCAPTSATFRYSCFNFLGCSGTFWQINPCQLPIIMLAVNDALAYYKQFEPQPTPVPSPPTEAPTNATQAPNPETTIAPSTPTTETTTVSAVSEEPPASDKPEGT